MSVWAMARAAPRPWSQVQARLLQESNPSLGRVNPFQFHQTTTVAPSKGALQRLELLHSLGEPDQTQILYRD